ncbi:MAG: PD-(D/E)XK nuclease family transposase, partial [Clostridiales bacterium]|nr:PD-(D/E)XK nuclease family transposase [Clostridiales bacterium]
MESKEKSLQHERNLERLKALRPIDDDFMRCLFRNNIPLTQELIDAIFPTEGLRIRTVETQADLKHLTGPRSLCLDILASDARDKKYNIEIQRSDKGAGAKRSRYHSGALDVDLLKKKQDFDSLPTTYVIFITENDYFKQGLSMYHIERMIRETNEPFNDEAHIIYVNGQYRGSDALGGLMHDFSCSDWRDMKNKTLAEATRELKETEKGVDTMCRILEEMCNEARAEGRAEGMAKGIEMERRNTVFRMF